MVKLGQQIRGGPSRPQGRCAREHPEAAGQRGGRTAKRREWSGLCATVGGPKVLGRAVGYVGGHGHEHGR